MSSVLFHEQNAHWEYEEPYGGSGSDPALAARGKLDSNTPGVPTLRLPGCCGLSLSLPLEGGAWESVASEHLAEPRRFERGRTEEAFPAASVAFPGALETEVCGLCLETKRGKVAEVERRQKRELFCLN